MLVRNLIRFQPQGYGIEKYNCAIMREEHRTSGVAITQITMAKMEPLGEAETPASLIHLTRDDLQGTFDQLWDLGFRPKDAGSVNGELQATKEHLHSLKLINKELLSIAHTFAITRPIPSTLEEFNNSKPAQQQGQGEDECMKQRSTGN